LRTRGGCLGVGPGLRARVCARVLAPPHSPTSPAGELPQTAWKPARKPR
jgi:hypothetical protein